MTSYIEMIKKEINHLNSFDRWFIFSGILLQLIVGIVTKSNLITMISGFSGILAVILCAQRKLIQFLFSFIQLFTYVIIAYEQKFYGEIAENGFYFATMLFGMYWWYKGYDNTNAEIKVKHFSKITNVLIFILNLIIIGIVYCFLKDTNDTQPFLDSVSTVPAFIAQILMMIRYRECWIYWLIIDVASIIMWANAGNWVMVIQFIFWTINCLYALQKWKE